ncbi:NYN domain-containing protein [Rhizobium rhizogenes]|uniref:NYN domain-containing protein n=1 Tax=Rhizobium rhizogenes TaxID=359 RepID=UPI0022C572DE|nr:NYN domain-containing protein [Rhizobium rhizogenes]MCZ7486653.1 NYN domain-containing protein [Rhizobium rhizogenes]
MPLKETIRVIQSGQRRIKLFVDFWNVVINVRNQSRMFDVDVKWDKLAESLVSETRQGYFDDTTGELAGCYIFGSVSRSNAQESKFVERVVDHYGSKPGLFFNFAERVPKQTSISCSECGEVVKTRSESGVDVLLAIEMIKHATMREHEYLALVSGDRDFVPLLSYLRDQGQRVLHVATGNPDREIRSITWKQVALSEQYPALSRIRHDGYIVLTAPPRMNETAQVINAAQVPHDQMRIIDITKKDQISDKDLNFMIKNLGLYWKSSADDTERMFSQTYLSEDTNELRQRIADGSLQGQLPYVLHDGLCEAYFNGQDSHFPWIRTNDTDKRWSKLFDPG